jgi:hypothetical protein
VKHPAAVLPALFTALAGCGSRDVAVCPPKPTTPEHASLQLRRAQFQGHDAPANLVTKLEQSRFRYFRMLGEAFELRTCEAFRDLAPGLPVIPVHGDPHPEQFVVTATSYGLEDFDRAGFGPAIVDLVRYSAGLHVACSDVTWRCDPSAAVKRFLDAYRGTLVDRPILHPPSLVQRLRKKAPGARTSWLTWADTLMVRLAPSWDTDIRNSWERFRAEMRQIRPDSSAQSYDIVRVGWLSLGFGSALERKVLIRIAGPTTSDDDDVIIEAREGVTPTERGCVLRASYGQSLILGRRVPDVQGFAPLRGGAREFWVQSWDPGYAELSIRDINTQAELEELAVDAAHQLAGHLWTYYEDSVRPHQQYAQLTAFDATRVRVERLARELATESNAAWDRFRSDPR